MEIDQPTKKRGRPKKDVEAVIPQEENDGSSPAPPSRKTNNLTKKQSGKTKHFGPLEKGEKDPRPAKRARHSPDVPEVTKSRAKAIGAATNSNKPKAVGGNSKSNTISESNSPVVRRGPPIPRSNLGLFIVRRETPDGGDGFLRTRSGRHSIKPVSYWKGEKIEYNTDATEDHFAKRNFLMPTIKEVLRTEDADQPKRTRAKSKAPKAKATKSKQRSDSESDESALEPWELESGFINGDIKIWNPADPLGSESAETDADIAFSVTSIVPTQTPNASFGFAKIFTLPFFGSGMVELPPGGIKRRKNSRKMQLIFFVHRGRVQVMVNETTFRIGQGGMWQVPRGKMLLLNFSKHN